jgi:hypothetical protein
MFDGRVYNVLTLNATVREIVDALRSFVPDVELSFVDSPIMNQLSYEVSSQRFRDRGFTFFGDIHRGIGDTISLLRAAKAVWPPPRVLGARSSARSSMASPSRAKARDVCA